MSIFDPDEQFNLHIGMRMTKTVVSIFLSVIISDYIGGVPISSAIAALVCTLKTKKESFSKGKNRIIGTAIGGLFGALFIYLTDLLEIPLFTIPYYFLMCLMLFPVMKLTLLMNIPGATAYAAMIMLMGLLSYAEEIGGQRYFYLLMRLIDTIIGVLVALLVNLILPNHKTEE